MGLMDRSFYERQGAEALATGREFDCSMESTNEAVIAMMRHYADEFTSVLDVGCGANLAYDLPLVAAGKRVVGVDFALNFLRLTPSDRRVFNWRKPTRCDCPSVAERLTRLSARRRSSISRMIAA